MKLFDMRLEKPSETFHSMTESVRDVQFNPHAYWQFSAVSENGKVQLWDIRLDLAIFRDLYKASYPLTPAGGATGVRSSGRPTTTTCSHATGTRPSAACSPLPAGTRPSR